MTESEFRNYLLGNINTVWPPIASARMSGRNAAGKIVPNSYFPSELILGMVIPFMYPLVKYVLINIGLPWLHEAARYSELWRVRFHHWIDSEYKRHGLDPVEAEAAGNKLREMLEKTTDRDIKAAWERLLDLFRQSQN